VRDTGAPTISVTLKRTAYPEKGDPEDVSPYAGTSLQPVGLTTTSVTPVAPVPAAPKGAQTKPATKKAESKVAAPTKRPPAFVVAGAPAEPLNEMALTQRAELLSAWIGAHPKTKANVRHYLYQHSWIVTGAGFGWWHGADALRKLIAVDRVAQQRWGIGKKSELVARSALADVEARTK
jgi:hypothetical protein